MVCDWAKALLGLGKLCWLLDLTHKGDINKHKLAIGQLNIQGTAIMHDLFDNSSLTNELAAVGGYFNLVV